MSPSDPIEPVPPAPPELLDRDDVQAAVTARYKAQLAAGAHLLVEYSRRLGITVSPADAPGVYERYVLVGILHRMGTHSREDLEARVRRLTSWLLTAEGISPTDDPDADIEACSDAVGLINLGLNLAQCIDVARVELAWLRQVLRRDPEGGTT